MLSLPARFVHQYFAAWSRLDRMVLGSRQWVYFSLGALRTWSFEKWETPTLGTSWLTTPARITGVGHGRRGRPAPSAGRCSGRGGQPAAAPAERQVHLCLWGALAISRAHLAFLGAPAAYRRAFGS